MESGQATTSDFLLALMDSSSPLSKVYVRPPLDIDALSPEQVIVRLLDSNRSPTVQKRLLSPALQSAKNLFRDPDFSILPSILVEDFAHVDRILTVLEGVAEYDQFRGQISSIVNASDETSGLSVLMLCCSKGKVGFVQRLVQLGADCGFRNKQGQSVLHFLAKDTGVDLAKFLVDHGADPTAQDEERGQLPLHLVCSRGYGAEELGDYLLTLSGNDARFTTDKEGFIPLWRAAEVMDWDVMRILLRERPEEQMSYQNQKLHGDTLGHHAVRLGKSLLLKVLLASGARPDAKNNDNQTLLHIAARSWDVDILETLIYHHADPNALDANERSPLDLAVETRQTETVRYLLDRFSADPSHRSTTGSTLAHTATRLGYLDVIETLVKQNVSFILPDRKGWMPIHYAAQNGSVVILELLLEIGTPVNYRTRDDWVPLHIAVINANAEAAELLIGAGAEMNAKGGEKGATAMHLVSQNSDLQNCAKVLLSSGVDLTIRDLNGDQPLHLAAHYGNLSVVQMLLHEGADPLSQNAVGNTAFHLSIASCYPGVVAALIDHLLKEPFAEAVWAALETGNHVGETALHELAKVTTSMAHFENEDIELANLLLKYTTNIGSQHKNTWETPLHYWARSGNDAVLAEVFRHLDAMTLGRGIHRLSKIGASPLMVASEIGHWEIVRMLLENKARTDVFDEEGRAALHIASENGHFKVVSLLLQYQAFADAKTKSGITAVHLAAEHGASDIVDLLVESYSARSDLLTLLKKTPLHVAAESGKREICERLLGHGSNPQATDKDLRTPLHLAASKGHTDVVKLFLGLSSADTFIDKRDVNGFNPGHLAALNGQSAVVRVLLDFNMDVTLNSKVKGDDLTAIHLAAASGQVDTVTLLLQSGAVFTEENRDGMTPVHLAAIGNHLSVLKALCSHVSPNICSLKTGLTPLHVAAYHGNTSILQELVQSVPVSTLTEQPTTNNSFVRETSTEPGLTALHFGSQAGHDDVVRFLLNYPDIHIETKGALTGITAMHIAAKHNRLSSMAILLTRSASSDFRDGKGRTPLMIAAGSGFYDMTFLLISQGASVVMDDVFGWTALHFAASSGHVDIVKLLCEKGALTTHKTVSGKVPLSLAVPGNHTKVFKFLLKQPHNAFDLVQDSSFLMDLMIFSDLHRQKPLQDFITLSPSPVEIALKISNYYATKSMTDREHEKDLIEADLFCEFLAHDILITACSMERPARIFRAVDQSGKSFIEFLVEGDHKKVSSIPEVQDYLTDIWKGFQHWPKYSEYIVYILLFIFPPFWFLISLPFSHRLSRTPFIKMACRVISHCYFIILLILVSMNSFQKLYERTSGLPTMFEWMTFVWAVGKLIEEIPATNRKWRFGMHSTIPILFGIAIIFHVATFSTWDREIQLDLFYSRNFVLSLCCMASCLHIITFLSLSPVFGPIGLLIWDVMKDLFRFLGILVLFVVGFTFCVSAVYLETKPTPADTFTFGRNLTRYEGFDPIQSFQKLYYSLFDHIKKPEFPSAEYGPAFAAGLMEALHMVYLMVIIIVISKLLVASFTETYKRQRSRSNFEWKYGRMKLILEADSADVTPPPLNILTWIWKSISTRTKNCRTRVEPTEKSALADSKRPSMDSAGSHKTSREILWRRYSVTGSKYSSKYPDLEPPRTIRNCVDWKAVITRFHDHPETQIDVE